MSVLYLEHFELKADPFRITPDTDFFFTGGRRGDILEGLVVAAMDDEGIVSVIGEVGMGKTMLSRMLLERLHGGSVDTVYLPNPAFDRDEILEAITRDLLARAPGGNRAERVAQLEAALIQRYGEGRRVVVIIDEAHSMPPGTLEEIRLLSNLETSRHKLLKIMLFGQPELDELLASPSLRQVKDRISFRFVLQPLTPEEVKGYLDFRLRKAGHRGKRLFTPGATRLLAKACEGRSRRLNMIADKALLAAFAEGAGEVSAAHVRRACEDGAAPVEATGRGSSRAWFAAASRTVARRGRWAVLAAMLATGVAAGYAAARWRPVDAPLADVAVSQPKGAAALQAARPAPAAAAAPAPGSGSSHAPALTTASAKAEEPPLPRQPTLAQRMARTEQDLRRTGGVGYTLQLLAMRAPSHAALQAVLNRYEALLGASPLWVNDRTYGGVPYHAVYYGRFASRQEAVQAIASLPPPIREHRPVVRSFSALIEEARS